MKLLFSFILFYSTNLLASEVQLPCLNEALDAANADYSWEVCERSPESRDCELARQGCGLQSLVMDAKSVIQGYQFLCYPPAPGFMAETLYEVRFVSPKKSSTCELNLQVVQSWDDSTQ